MKLNRPSQFTFRGVRLIETTFCTYEADIGDDGHLVLHGTSSARGDVIWSAELGEEIQTAPEPDLALARLEASTGAGPQ